MNEKTKEAVENCVARWQGIYDGSVKIAGTKCALCKIYDYDYCMSNDNEECPVSEITGCPNCDETPFYRIRTLESNIPCIRMPEKKIAITEFKTLTKKMLDILKSIPTE